MYTSVKQREAANTHILKAGTSVSSLLSIMAIFCHSTNRYIDKPFQHYFFLHEKRREQELHLR